MGKLLSSRSPFRWKKVVLSAACATLVIAAAAYGAYGYLQLLQEKAALAQSNAQLQSEVAGYESSLAASRATIATTTASLQAEQNKNNGFSSEINLLSGTVTTLQKITATDPQLLEKYSKVYFLSENYAPASLSGVDPQYLFEKSRPELVLSGILPDLEALLAAAARDGVPLQIVSAYRSYYEQSSLKLGYKITYGAGTANQFSAEQGYSEHQLGTAVDFGEAGLRNNFAQFASSTGYQWLTNNAYRFGFILSYPQNNTYYQFEPWHWRFVGVGLATKLHDANEYFYNMSQRDIDQYLVSFFD